MITDMINPTINWIIQLIQNNNIKTIEIILNSIGYSLVLIFSLIYNEIIICNFCGLNINTKKFLEKKQIKELSSIMDDDIDDNDDNDDINNEKIELKNEID